MAILTPRELELKNQLYNQYKANKTEFIKKYKGNTEQVMTGRAIKTAKITVLIHQQILILVICMVSLL